MKKKLLTILAALGLMVIPTAVMAGVTGDEKQQSNRILDVYRKSQPVPEFPWSQLRQSLIEIETAQAQTTATTSFFFNLGVRDPIDTCPSIGFPIPSTYQLTNPYRTAGDSDDVAVGQLEPNGVYTGDSSATYVMCIVGKKANASYWEGHVKAEVGLAHWDYDKGRIVRDAKEGLMSKGR